MCHEILAEKVGDAFVDKKETLFPSHSLISSGGIYPAFSDRIDDTKQPLVSDASKKSLTSDPWLFLRDQDR